MLVLVLQNIVSCLKELMAQGQPVKLDGLGTFRPVIETGQCVASVEAAQTLGADALIKGVHIRFIPEGMKDERLTAPTFKQECVFELHDVVECVKKTVDGKVKTYQTRMPISTYAIAMAQGE